MGRCKKAGCTKWVYRESTSEVGYCEACEEQRQIDKNPFLLWKCRDWASLPMEEKGVAILKAARQGHVEQMYTFLNRGDDINVRDPNEKNATPLHLATKYDKPEVMKVLLKVPKPPARSSLELNAVDSEGNSALHYALISGHPLPIKLLLKAGLKLDTRNIAGRTPIMEACRWGRPSAVYLLLKADHKVKIAKAHAKECTSALVDATKALDNHEKLLEDAETHCRIKEARAKCHLKPAQKKLAKFEAEQARQGVKDAMEARKICEEKLSVATRNEAIAAIALSEERTKQLEQTDNDGKTMLILSCSAVGKGSMHPSCIKGRLKIVKQLCDHRANLCATDSQGKTALIHVCFAAGESDAVSLAVALLDAARSGAKSSQFRLESQQPRVEIATKAREDLEHQYRESKLPSQKKALQPLLDEAIEYEKTVKAVEAEEAKIASRLEGMINMHDHCGWTALHASCLRGNEEMTRILLDGGQVDKELMAQAEEEFQVTGVYPDWVNDLECLTYKGCHHSPRLPDGTTPLMIACEEGFTNIAILLTERGASMSDKDNDGRTCLHRGAQEADLCRALLNKVRENGLKDLRREERGGENCDMALEKKKKAKLHPWDKEPELTEKEKRDLAFKEQEEIRKVMKYIRPFVSATDNRGCTPLHLACIQNCAGAVDALVDYGADLDATNLKGEACTDLETVPAVKKSLERARKMKTEEIARLERLRRSNLKTLQ
eukprot:g4831.t1